MCKISFPHRFIFKNINEYDKIYIYSPSLHQKFYQKLIKSFSKNIPINNISNVPNEENIDVLIEEIVQKRLSKIRN